MGRLSKEAKLKPPEYTETADLFMKIAGENYEDWKKMAFKYAKQNYRPADEDMFQNCLIKCFESIARNNLTDTSVRGCCSYFLKAFIQHTISPDSYTQRWDSSLEDDDIASNLTRYQSEEPSTYHKTKQQLFDDYSTIWTMDLVESHFDSVTFHCFRLKHLAPCTYERLREITKVRDCKRRVIKVMNWLRENVTRQQIYEAFCEDFPDYA